MCLIFIFIYAYLYLYISSRWLNLWDGGVMIYTVLFLFFYSHPNKRRSLIKEGGKVYCYLTLHLSRDKVPNFLALTQILQDLPWPTPHTLLPYNVPVLPCFSVLSCFNAFAYGSFSLE